MNNTLEVIKYYDEKINYLQNRINDLTIKIQYLEKKDKKNRDLVEEMIDLLILSELDDSTLKEYGFSKENIKKVIMNYYDNN